MDLSRNQNHTNHASAKRKGFLVRLSIRQAQLLAALITALTFGTIGVGLNALFTSLAQ